MKAATFASLALVVVALASAAAASSPPRLTVYAASSLTNVLPKLDGANRYSFGGSNALAAQIAQGAPVDVFAAANTKLPAQLHAHGLCSKTVVFAKNELVVVVPVRNRAGIASVRDLTRHGVKIVVAAPGVPVGDYTLEVLARLGLTAAVERNVVSRENDVREVLAKVALGEADAGFVYATDARTVTGKVDVIRVPARAQPAVAYGACVVRSSGHPGAAMAFIRRLLAPNGQAALRRAGFLRP